MRTVKRRLSLNPETLKRETPIVTKTSKQRNLRKPIIQFESNTNAKIAEKISLVAASISAAVNYLARPLELLYGTAGLNGDATGISDGNPQN